MTRSEMQYVIKEEKNGKSDRFYVWDKVEKRVKKNKLTKYKALALEGELNKMPHKDSITI